MSAIMAGVGAGVCVWNVETGGTLPLNWSVGTPVVESIGPGYAVPFQMGFRFGDIRNAAEFTVLFDMYKLLKIEIRMEYMANEFQQTNANQFACPTMEYHIDKDSFTHPGVAALAEISAKKTKSLRYVQTISLRPNCMLDVTTGGFKSGGAPWMDMAGSNTTEYNGLVGTLRNFALPGTAVQPNTGSCALRVQAKYFFACKGVR